MNTSERVYKLPNTMKSPRDVLEYEANAIRDKIAKLKATGIAYNPSRLLSEYKFQLKMFEKAIYKL